MHDSQGLTLDDKTANLASSDGECSAETLAADSKAAVTDQEQEVLWTQLLGLVTKAEEAGPSPQAVEVVLADRVYINKTGLSTTIVSRLAGLAAFENPECHRAQGLRLSTDVKPPMIFCAENHPRYLALPRGCCEDAVTLLRSVGIQVNGHDRRESGVPIAVDFRGTLQAEQQTAFESLAAHDFGVLAATTAFGKTVVAARLIAERGVNTLVLVHRQLLLDQWIERLSEFLSLDRSALGQIGGGKREPRGCIDVALIQSLCRHGVVDDLVGKYGHLVVDECHHIPATSFAAVARAAGARYVTGLSATTTRKDGNHPIIFMHCGQIRHQVDARAQAELRPFDHRVIVRTTDFRASKALEAEAYFNIHRLYAALANDRARNEIIVTDVLEALAQGRSPVVLTERRKHLDLLADLLNSQVRNLVVLRGGMSKKRQREVAKQLASIPPDQERLLLATRGYLGEGFDDARLDTLFLTLPISWKGNVHQYAGRLHRPHDQKTEVVIYDYADLWVTMLGRMYDKRLQGYQEIGYRVEGPLRGIPPVFWPSPRALAEAPTFVEVEHL
jgi:superfamily II DNA or RNA helicase